MNLKEYIVYKGESFVCLGTIQECAQHMGVLPKTVRYYATPSYKKRAAKRKKANYLTVTRLEEDEE
ncbi:hypothetical protein QUF83_15210 [Bacillus cereus]|uniref:hypothetical protein n=1 Tax=Bacillus cereus TaxID=1396 RepID=UPI0025A2DDCF|nr:hypothetical protein [Bacillus cereus]MDM5237473.1 hypothetical protein [Bacillus cereus]